MALMGDVGGTLSSDGNEGSKRLRFRWQYLSNVESFLGIDARSDVSQRLWSSCFTAASSVSGSDDALLLLLLVVVVSAVSSTSCIDDAEARIASTQASCAVIRGLSLLDGVLAEVDAPAPSITLPSSASGEFDACPGTLRRFAGLSITTISSSE